MIIKPCPFCGHEVNLEDPDTLYPNGTGYRIHSNGFTEYVSLREVPVEQWCYSIHCVTTSGGCGVELSANSKVECLEKWNTRIST